MQNIAHHFPHVRILGTHNCGKELKEALKHQGSSRYFLCYFDYVEWVVVSFVNQIQYEYYGGNRSVYNYNIYVEHFFLCNISFS